MKKITLKVFSVLLIGLTACSDPVIPLVAPPPEPTPTQNLTSPPQETADDPRPEEFEPGPVSYTHLRAHET